MSAKLHRPDVRPSVTVDRIADTSAGSDYRTPVREVGPDPAERTPGVVQGPPSGPDVFGPAVEKLSGGQLEARTAASGKSNTSGPTSVRTVLLVLGGSTAGAGIAGHLTVVLSSTAPFEILGWLIVGGCVLVAVVKLGRAVGARLPWGGSR